MILGGRHGHDVLAVRHDDEAGFLARQEFLDHHLVAGRAELPAEHGLRGRNRFLGVFDDDDTLSGRQTRSFYDDGSALLPHPAGIEGVTRERGIGRRRNAVALEEFLGEGLGTFELGRGLHGTKAAQARGLEGVDHTHDQRRLGADDGESNAFRAGELDEACDVLGGHLDIAHARLGGRAAVAGRDEHLGNLG